MLDSSFFGVCFFVRFCYVWIFCQRVSVRKQSERKNIYQQQKSFHFFPSERFPKNGAIQKTAPFYQTASCCTCLQLNAMEGRINAKIDNTTPSMLNRLFPFLFARPSMQSTKPAIASSIPVNARKSMSGEFEMTVWMFIFSEALISFKMIPGRNADASAFMLIKSPTRAKRKPFIKFLKKKKVRYWPRQQKSHKYWLTCGLKR